MSACRIVTRPPELLASGQMRLQADLAIPGKPTHPIRFEFTPPEPDTARCGRVRPFLLAGLVPAMRAGLPLELDQPIDPVTHSNLMEWQGAYADWFPNRLQSVPILAPRAPSPPTPPRFPGALTAFSGGVDSCFTVHHHSRVPSDDDRFRHLPLSAGLMVHGFDIPEDQDAVFESAYANSQAILDAFGLPMFRMRTNLRTLGRAFDVDWETETHGIWLAAALACLEPWFTSAVIPSSYPYANLLIPWGSNPITDPLFSSDRTPFHHDGGTHSKFDKVRSMAKHPAIASRVRVCWSGPQLDRNCGRCFKCVTTQVSFWLSGTRKPAAFPVRCTLRQIATVKVRTAHNNYLLAALRTRARRKGQPKLARALLCARLLGNLTRSAIALRKSTKRAFRKTARRLGLRRSRNPEAPTPPN